MKKGEAFICIHCADLAKMAVFTIPPQIYPLSAAGFRSNSCWFVRCSDGKAQFPENYTRLCPIKKRSFLTTARW